MGCILKGPILFPFIDCKCNERKVINIISFCYENDKLPPLRSYTHRIYLLLLESETSGKFRVIRSIRHQKEINRSLEEVSMRFRKRICGKKAWSFQEKGFSTSSNNVCWDWMFPTTKVNCFIFACSHPSSVKKLDVQNRNTITYIRSDRFKSRMTNIRLSLSFLHWKKQNEFHLSFCSGHSEFIFFTQRLEFCARLVR